MDQNPVDTPAPEPVVRPKTVVVVDDNEDLCEFLSDLLTSVGISVTVCPHTDDAVEKIQTLIPNAVLLDLQTPQDREAGLRVLAHLRAEPVTSAIPVLLLTADHGALRRHAAILQELEAIPVPKPFDSWHLLRLIDQATSPSPRMSP